VVLSVFWGTPPAKPLDCKIRPNSSGALCRDLWAHPTGGEPRLSRAFICFLPGDIIKMSVSFQSQFHAFRCRVLFSRFQGNKKPCFHSGKQGVKSLMVRLPAHLSIQIGFGLLASIYHGQSKAKRIAPARLAITCRFCDAPRRPNRD
jgi:hypothetical protein